MIFVYLKNYAKQLKQSLVLKKVTKKLSIFNSLFFFDRLLQIINYVAVPICGTSSFEAELNVNKTIHPPAYPAARYSFMNCRYTIIAAEGKRIRFWVINFGTPNVGSNEFSLKVKVKKYLFLSR